MDKRLGSILQELSSMYSPVQLDVRAENAYGVAVKLFELIERMIPEEEEQRRIMGAWFKSVRDRDPKKFKRAIRRYDRLRNGQPS